MKRLRSLTLEGARKSNIRQLTYCIWILSISLPAGAYLCLTTRDHYEYLVLVIAMVCFCAVLRSRLRKTRYPEDQHASGEST